ncbi:MAG: two-component regulator propeller domain-containing protein [Balneolaceae bacterium]|nr:two-component regulator propeller domain-containing protein [Balneolaceae bacterium]
MPAAGQQLPFRSYSIERGLSESVVNRMMQDSEGYIWVATSYGLNRFDGRDFRTTTRRTAC